MFLTIAIAIGLAALALALGLNTSYVPGPLDEATRLEGTAATPTTADVPITKTANFAGTTFDFGAAPLSQIGIGQPIAAVVKVSAGSYASSNETYVFQLFDSPDGVTFTAIGPTVSWAASVGFAGKIAVPGFRSQRYVALQLTVGGTSPTITYDAWLTTQGFPRT